MNIQKYMTQARMIARRLIPVGSENDERYEKLINQIKIVSTDRGFKVVWETDNSPHMIYQNEGFEHYKTGDFIDVHQGFIEESFRQITEYIYNDIAGNREFTNNIFKQALDKPLPKSGIGKYLSIQED
jgi:hypothetical protein